MLYDRRSWLQQSMVALAGLAVSTETFAAPRNGVERFSKIHLPATTAILLNSNENAYGPSPMAKKAMLDHYKESNRYPDEYIPVLKQKIADHWKVSPQHILIGAGSSEIIGLSTLFAATKNKKIVTAEPGYKSWNGQAAAFGLDFIRVGLTPERKTDLPAMLAAINAETSMVYVCNPNNPTGTFVDADSLRNFTIEAAKKTMVFVDEAYTEYAEIPSLADLAAANPNVIVAKTFSKIYGLAGARIGYAIAHPDTIKKLATYQAWANASVSVLSSAAAIASLDDTTFVNETRTNTQVARNLCVDTFKQLSFDYIPSHTNFMMFDISKFKKNLIKEMEAKNIFVQSRKHFDGEWCRVSMGTVPEMQAFCQALKAIV
ncbi:MAG: histidinol-phosphate transaminase [Bacteroidota bacterium]|nr:histidinol-phosphate transaminase [Ferruginibacter sp.]